MYTCPVCLKSFPKDIIAKHYLKCWKENNPYHKSKDAPRSSDVEVRDVNEDTLKFFAQKEKNNG